MVLIDGQAGIASGRGGSTGLTREAAGEAGEALGYGLTVSAPGLVPYVDPAFRVEAGMAPVEVVVEAPGNVPRAKAASSGGILGDVNADGRVDFFDALLVALYSVDPSLVLPNNGNISLGDVNADGRVTLTDAHLIAAYLNNPSDPTLPTGIGQPVSGGGQGDALSVTRTAFESSTPSGYTRVTLNHTRIVWGVPAKFTADSNVGTVAYMVLGNVKGCSFANTEADRPSKVYVKTDTLGRLTNFESETVCRKTSSRWSSEWSGLRITHLRFFDESSPTNVREVIYNVSTGQYVLEDSEGGGDSGGGGDGGDSGGGDGGDSGGGGSLGSCSVGLVVSPGQNCSAGGGEFRNVGDGCIVFTPLGSGRWCGRSINLNGLRVTRVGDDFRIDALP